jgi:ABC-type transport system involved in cytochrome c biogenesis permease subunit
MSDTSRLQYLRVALVVFGLIFMSLIVLMAVWPAGWRWQPNQPEYEQMIMGVYATLGVFLIIASRNPLQHRSLIWFTVWSSVVHAGIMTAQAVLDSAERGHLLGDVRSSWWRLSSVSSCPAAPLPAARSHRPGLAR